MKHSNTIINIVLGIGLIVLYILHFTAKSGNTTSVVSTKDSGTIAAQLPIAYINIDSLLLNYNYSKDLNEVVIRKRENAQATLTEKGRKLDAEVQEFQRKRDNNAFLSQQSFNTQQQALLKKQQDLQLLEQNLSNQLAKEQQGLNDKLRETIYSFIRSYNKDKKYQVILSNTMNDNILIANPAYNITNEVVERLNSAYTKKED